MTPLPRTSPFDGGEIIVTRFYCPDSDISIEGRFSVTTPFPELSSEQLYFVETFVRCEGKLSRMEDELGISYPTIRNRLHEVIRSMGYEPGKDETNKDEPSKDKSEEIEVEVEVAASGNNRKVLEELDAGTIDFEAAMKMLQGEK